MANPINVNLVFNANTKQIKEQLNSLKGDLNSLTNMSKMDFGGPNIKAQFDAATGSLSQLRAILNQTTTESGQLNITQFMQQTEKAGLTAEKLKASFGAFGVEGEQAFMKLAQSVMNAQMPIRNTNGLVNKLWTSLKNVATWQISSKLLYGFINQIGNAYNYAQDLNESLNNIRIVTGYGTEEMSAFAEQANKAAKALSTSTLEYTNASLIYYQQGLTGKEVTDRADVTVKLANVASKSGEEVSEWMTAIWNNFDNGSKSLEYYADVITKLGAETASSSDEIAGGLEKFSAVADTVGLSYEYAASALATITAQTRQSEDVVGTALKTLFARIESLSLGDTLDDGTTLNKYSEALYKVGINVKDASGELKDMDIILDEMGATWGTLSKDQQVALAQTVGGIRQYNQLIALMDNWDFFQQNVETAKSATGALNEQNEIYAESWEAANKRVKASAEALYSDLLKDDFFISLTDGFAEFLSGIDKVIDAMGGLKTLLPAIILLVNKLFGDKIMAGIAAFSSGMKATSLATQKAVANEKLAYSKQMATTMGGENSAVGRTMLQQGTAVHGVEQQILNINRQLTAEEQKTLQIGLDRMNQLNDEAMKKAELCDKTKEENIELERKKKVQQEILDAQIAERTKSFSNINQNLQQNLPSKIKVPTDLDFSKLAMESNSAEEFSQKVQKTLSEVNGKFKMTKSEAAQFAKATTQAFNEFQNAANKTNTDKVENEIKELDSQIDTGKSKLNQYEKELNDINKAQTDAAANTANTAKQMSNLTWGQAFQGFTSVAMSSAMAINSIRSSWDTLKNPDTSGIEKLTSVLMTFAMTAPLVMGVGKAIMSFASLFKTVESAETTLRTLNGVAALFEAASIRESNNAKFEGNLESGATLKSLRGETFARLGKAIGSAFATAAPYILAVAVAAASVYAIVKTINKEADKLKKFEENTKALKKAATEASQAYENFANTRSSYDEAVEGMDKLTKGTVEYTKAVIKANEEARKLMEENEELKKQYTINEDGLIVFNEGAVESAEKEKLQQNINAQNSVIEAERREDEQRQRVQQQEVLRDSNAGVGINSSWGTAGGAAAGMVAGGVAWGAASSIAMASQSALLIGLTSIWNPLGWGALIAGAIGAAVAIGVSSAVGEETQKEIEAIEALEEAYDKEGEKVLADRDKMIEALMEAGYSKSFAEALTKDEQAIRDLIHSNKELERANLANAKQIMATQFSDNEEYQNSEYKEGISSAAAQKYIDMTTEGTDEYKELAKKIDDAFKDTDEDVIEMFKEVMGPDYELKHMNGTHGTIYYKGENMNEEGKKNTVSNEEIKTMMIQAMARQKLDNATEILKLEKEAKAVWQEVRNAGITSAEAINAIYGQVVTGVITDLSQLSQKEINELDNNEKISNMSGFQQAKENETAKRKAVIDELSDTTKEVINDLNKKVTDSLNSTEFERVANVLDQSVIAGGEEAGNTLKDMFNMAGESAPELVEKMDEVNWATDSYDNIVQKLNNDTVTMTDSFKEYYEQMKEVNLIAETGADLFNTLYENIGKVKDIVEKTNVGDVISDEDYQKLIDAGANVEDTFAKTYDGWIKIKDNDFSDMVSDTSDTIEKAIDYSKQLSDMSKTANYTYTENNKKEAIDKIDSDLAVGKITKDEAEDKKEALDYIKNHPINLTHSDETKQKEEIDKFLNNYGLTDNEKDLFFKSAKVDKEAYDNNKITLDSEEFKRIWGSLQKIVNADKTGEFETENTVSQFLSLEADSSSEAQGILATNAETQDQYNKYLSVSNGLTQSKIELEEDVAKALDQETRSLSNLSEETRNNEEVVRSLTLAKYGLNTGVSELVEQWDSFEESIEEGKSAEVLNDVGNILEKTFGVSEIDNSFVTQHWEEIKQLATGTGDATQLVETLSNDLATLSLQTSELPQNIKTDAIATLDTMGELGLVYGSSITDMSNTTAQHIQNLITQAGNGASAVVEAFRSAGYQLEIVDNQLKSITKVSGGSALNLNAYRANIKKNQGSGNEPEEFDPKRYHEIDEVLDSISKKLDIISTKKDKAFGADKIQFMDQELKQLEVNLDATQKKLDQARSYLNTDRDTILKYGAQFDEFGNITNYDEIRQKYYDQYKKNPEAYEDEWNKFNEDLDQYEETLDTVLDLEKDHLDQIYEMKELALEKIEYTVTFEIEASEDTLKYIDFIMKRLDDDAYDAAKSINFLGEKTQETLDNIETYKTGINEILDKAGFTPEEIERFFGGDGSVFEGKSLTQDEVDTLRDYRDKLIESSDQLREFREQIYETALNALDAWNNKLQENSDKIERCNKLLETHQNIIDTVGKKYLGIDNKVLASIAEARTALAQSSVEAAAAEFRAKQAILEEAKAKLATLTDPEAIKAQEELIKEIETSVNDAEETMMDSLVTAIETAGDVFESTVERIMDTLNEALGNIEELMNKFEKQRKIEELYLADHKKLYEINKLNRDIQNSIDQTDNVKAQRELAAIAQEVMAYQADGAQMSKYDLEYLQKRYELKKAEIALEEAQNAKNQVKLQRDAKGNWGYVYTADQKNIDKAQGDYDKALYDVQEFSYTTERDLTKQRFQLQEEFFNAIKDLEEQNITDTEEYNTKLAEIYEHYTTRINAITMEIKDLTYQNGIINREYATTMADTYKETLLGQMYPTYNSFEELTKSESEAIAITLEDLSKAYSQWSLDVDAAFSAAGLDAKTFADYMGTTFTKTVKQTAIDTSNAASDIANNMKKALLGEDGNGGAIGAIISFEQQFASKMEKIYGEGGIADLVTKAMEDISKAAKKAAEDVVDANNTIQNNTPPTNFNGNPGGGGGITTDPKIEKEPEEADKPTDPNDIINDILTRYPDARTAMGNGAYVKGSSIKAKGTGTIDPNTNYVAFSNNDGSISYFKASDVTRIEGTQSQFTFKDGATAAFTTQSSKTGQDDSYQILDIGQHKTNYRAVAKVKSKSTGKTKYFYLSDLNTDKALSGKAELKSGDIWQAEGISGSSVDNWNIKYWKGAKVKVKSNVTQKNDRDMPIGDKKGTVTKYKSDGKIEILLDAYTYNVGDSLATFTKADDYEALDSSQLTIQNPNDPWYQILQKYDTGGYTGSWGADGRLAMLHQKEIVLNAHDTENFLSAVKIVRSMSDMLEHNAHLAMQGLNLEQNFTRLLNNKQPIDQNVRIEAHFPNVTDRYEIEQAFNSLVNDATQYVNRN